MTKGQAARELANAICNLQDDENKLKDLIVEAGFAWTEFPGPAPLDRVFQAICKPEP